MLDEDQIEAASRTLHDHWRAGTKLAEPRAVACGRAIARKVTRSRRRSKILGRQVCSAGRSRPPAKPAKSTSMSTARWLDASCPKRSLPTAARPRWRETRCASASPNSPSAWRGICRRDGTLYRAAGARCGRHAASGDRDSGFAVCGFRQRRRRANHRRQCLRASVRARRADDVGLARARSGRGEAGHHAARQRNSSVTARTCSAIRGSRWRGLPMNCASSA